MHIGDAKVGTDYLIAQSVRVWRYGRTPNCFSFIRVSTVHFENIDVAIIKELDEQTDLYLDRSLRAAQRYASHVAADDILLSAWIDQRSGSKIGTCIGTFDLARSRDIKVRGAVVMI